MNAKTRTVLLSLMAIVSMVALAYAAVPLYRLFCQVTGYGGTTQVAEAQDLAPIDRRMKVRFTASTHRDMPWRFRPAQNSMTVTVGERALAFYKADNPTRRTITGTATFNVVPFKAGPYFSKIECFCFTEQTLAAGAHADMPVSFYIDPAIADDPQLAEVTEITLNYTFFALEAEDQTAALASTGD